MDIFLILYVELKMAFAYKLLYLLICGLAGEGRKRNQISVGSCSEVSLPGKVTESDIRALNASIQAPSGLEEPCFLKRLPIGNLGKKFGIAYDKFIHLFQFTVFIYY